jgi:hypothetical protein
VPFSGWKVEKLDKRKVSNGEGKKVYRKVLGEENGGEEDKMG